jgi:putative ABC transport system substrate-binding protein
LAIISSAHPDPKRFEFVEENVTIAAKKLGFLWQFFQAAGPNDYDEIFSRLANENFDAAYIVGDPQNNLNQSRIIELALRHLVPAVGEGTWWTKGGLLLSYGQDFNKTLAHGAEYVSKILRGAKPSDLPVEQATQLELGINLKTAKALGITVPPALLAEADEVIE